MYGRINFDSTTGRIGMEYRCRCSDRFGGDRRLRGHLVTATQRWRAFSYDRYLLQLDRGSGMSNLDACDDDSAFTAGRLVALVIVRFPSK